MNNEQIERLAQEIWDAMDKNERHGVRFGMFPAGKMRDAETKLAAVGVSSRPLSSALMAIAEKNGGMRG